MIHYMTADGIGTPWVANELRQVQLSGVPFRLHTLRMPSSVAHEAGWAQRINRDTSPIYPLNAVRMAVSLLLAPMVFRGRYFSALGNALLASRENARARLSSVAHFFVAACWALTLRKERVDLIHSQWIHSPGTVAMYGAWLLDVPFSFTGHAVDLFRQRVALTDKIKRADFIVCISTFHRDFYLEHGADANKLLMVYCGIDLDHFATPDSRQLHSPFTILSAGRLIEKKGFEYLLRACKRLKDNHRQFKCVIGGSGPLESDLRALVVELDLEENVMMTGEALTQEGIPDFMAQGDVFCLPCVWAADDDVDGLPQLLMEAMACGLPAVSTRLVGIPDLIVHEETGLLTTPRDDQELAETLEYAMDHYERMLEMAENGRRHLRKQFDISTCLQPLLDKFRMYVDRAEMPAAAQETAGRSVAPSGRGAQ